jgi:hypothetical protein
MKNIKALLGIGFVLAVFYVGFQLIPPYFNNYRFQDSVESEARLAANSNRTEQDIRDTVAKSARELDIPLTADQINVQRSGSEVQIWAKYTVHVDLPGYPMDLQFEPSSKGKRAF